MIYAWLQYLSINIASAAPHMTARSQCGYGITKLTLLTLSLPRGTIGSGLNCTHKFYKLVHKYFFYNEHNTHSKILYPLHLVTHSCDTDYCNKIHDEFHIAHKTACLTVFTSIQSQYLVAANISGCEAHFVRDSTSLLWTPRCFYAKST